MRLSLSSTLVFASLFSVNTSIAQINIANLPTPNNSYLQSSDVYSARVKQGNGEWKTLHPRMAESQDELIPNKNNTLLHNRDFSFIPLSFTPQDGPITIQVTKNSNKISENVVFDASNVEVIGADSAPSKINNNTIEFTLSEPKYVVVNFDVNSNKHVDGQHEVVKHMLTIFADPINNDLVEPNASSGNTKVVYDNSTTWQELVDADVIVFRAGYHDLESRFGLKGIPVTHGTKVWLHQNALVSGHIIGYDANGENGNSWSVADNVEIYGRGMLYMGDYRNSPSTPNNGPYWRPNDKAHTSTSSPYMVEAVGLNGGENTKLRGVIIGDIMWHGVVVGWNSVIDRVKIWGWHGNNDAFRPHNGSVVQNSFLRPVDDSFYAFDIDVKDNLVWPSFNGGFITCGWAGKYNTGGIKVSNTTMVYPEWTNIGNNNGIVMSQIGTYQECDGITINTMDVYGDPIAILNLKTSSLVDNSVWWDKASDNPGVRNIEINDLTIYGRQKTKSLVDKAAQFNLEDVTFNNLLITEFSDEPVTNADRSMLFTGSAATNNNILNINSDSGETPPVTSEYVLLESRLFAGYNFKATNGTGGLKLVNTNGTMVQWRLVETDNGYFYLENKAQNNERLKAVDGNLSFDLTQDTGNKVQWKKVATSNGYFYLESRNYPNKRLTASSTAQTTSTGFSLTTNTGFGTQWKEASF
ncbi:hypothetical protein [Echinimonas agarilytica]|uniref:Uncharacterized protein n=1 Tax=Echinimonas agarilytica TaxID=1215918 RepID=A0AA41W6J8_9GAMM|nr:hypothetical protein [Echinimonas agarilytica]MCM2679607.1 hypothetical protein [Echinimonas agarilytica]